MPGEPEASLRAELLEQIGAAQAALEAQLDQLQHAANQGGSTAALVIAQNQLSRLGGLGRTVEHARGVGLANVRAEVTAMIVAAQATVQQARTAAAGGQAAELALHEAQAEAHRITGDFMRDFYERKIFDHYLTFASPEDERAYREREEARRIEIEKARAEGTPEGELRAAQLAKKQMLDAKAYGADRSPDFQPTFNAIEGAEQRLSTQLAQRSQTTDAADLAILDGQSAPVAIPASVIASFAAQGISMPDQQQTGHGIQRERPSLGGAMLT